MGYAMKTALVSRTGRHVKAASGGAARGALIAVAALLPFLLISGIYRTLVASGTFLVRDVVIEGNASVSDAAIRSMVGLDVPRPIWSCRGESMERALELSPWVADAQVHVGSDGVISMHVVEARPVLLATVDGSVGLYDSRGVRLRPMQVGDLAEYPLVAGLTAVDERGGVDVRRVEDAERVLSAMTTSGLDDRRIVEMHHHDAYGWVLVLDNGAEVRLGDDRYSERLDRVREVLEGASRQGRSVAAIHADVANLRHISVELVAVEEQSR